MSEATIEEVRQELKGLRETVLTLCKFIGPHLSRDQMCTRYQVSRNTLPRMIETGKVPRPVNGKWLLSEVVEWETKK